MYYSNVDIGLLIGIFIVSTVCSFVVSRDIIKIKRRKNNGMLLMRKYKKI